VRGSLIGHRRQCITRTKPHARWLRWHFHGEVTRGIDKVRRVWHPMIAREKPVRRCFRAIVYL
jgi:hypothetical protein